MAAGAIGAQGNVPFPFPPPQLDLSQMTEQQKQSIFEARGVRNEVEHSAVYPSAEQWAQMTPDERNWTFGKRYQIHRENARRYSISYLYGKGSKSNGNFDKHATLPLISSVAICALAGGIGGALVAGPIGAVAFGGSGAAISFFGGFFVSLLSFDERPTAPALLLPFGTRRSRIEGLVGENWKVLAITTSVVVLTLLTLLFVGGPIMKFVVPKVAPKIKALFSAGLEAFNKHKVS